MKATIIWKVVYVYMNKASSHHCLLIVLILVSNNYQDPIS